MTALSLYYTHNLRGDLELLPRLYTFLRQLQAQAVDDEDDVLLCAVQPQARQTLLLDLGGSCAPEAWHCAATDNRSTLMVLDAMGYDAANATEVPAAAREKLRETVQMRLLDGENTYQEGGVMVGFGGDVAANGVQIVMAPGPEARLEGRRFYPAALAGGHVGVAQISATNGQPTLISHHVFAVPPRTAPAPTIAGAVDFVVGEARYYQKKRTK